jgi:hypothetical protein
VAMPVAMLPWLGFGSPSTTAKQSHDEDFCPVQKPELHPLMVWHAGVLDEGVLILAIPSQQQRFSRCAGLL